MMQLILVIHLILAVCLIAVVLLQRTEGGALGIGGGGGGTTSARSQATPLTKLTWVLATAFLVTSLVLFVLGKGDQGTTRIPGADQLNEGGDALQGPIENIPAEDLLAPPSE